MRRHKSRALAAVAPPVVPAAPVAPEGIPNTPEMNRDFYNLQTHKISLSKLLRRQGAPAIVQIGMAADGGWFFHVRGVPPGPLVWQGVPVRYVASVREVALPAHQR